MICLKKKKIITKGISENKMIYGYARCSTSEDRQDINRQKRELIALGVKEDKDIYFEYESGMKTDRTQFNRLLDTVKKGDTIVATEVSRLTRSTSHLCEILKIAQEKQIQIIIGSFNADCRNDVLDPMTKGMLMMWGVFAEMERDIITQRIKSGMENAKVKGVKIGRPNLSIDDLPEKFWKYYYLYKDGKINKSELARLTGVSRPTVYEYIRMIEEEIKPT